MFKDCCKSPKAVLTLSYNHQQDGAKCQWCSSGKPSRHYLCLQLSTGL